jgi:hypothetical protein
MQREVPTERGHRTISRAHRPRAWTNPETRGRGAARRAPSAGTECPCAESRWVSPGISEPAPIIDAIPKGYSSIRAGSSDALLKWLLFDSAGGKAPKTRRARRRSWPTSFRGCHQKLIQREPRLLALGGIGRLSAVRQSLRTAETVKTRRESPRTRVGTLPLAQAQRNRAVAPRPQRRQQNERTACANLVASIGLSADTIMGGRRQLSATATRRAAGERRKLATSRTCESSDVIAARLIDAAKASNRRGLLP